MHKKKCELVWSGQNYSEESGSVGDVSRRPGAPNMLRVGENVAPRTRSSPAQAPQVSGEAENAESRSQVSFSSSQLFTP